MRATVYVRHGERTPVGIRMSDPPASIPEHWMMCKTARRFRAAVSAAPLGAPEGVFGAGVGKGAPAGAEAVVGGGVADGDTLRMRKTVERADGTSAEGEWCVHGLSLFERVVSLMLRFAVLWQPARGTHGHWKTGAHSPLLLCHLVLAEVRSIQNTYNYGTALRKLYVDKLGFLPDTTRSAGETYFRHVTSAYATNPRSWTPRRSTNMPRTIESLQHIVHGLYPTSKCENEALTQILIRYVNDGHGFIRETDIQPPQPQ